MNNNTMKGFKEVKCKINKRAYDNDTWLSPYVGYSITLFIGKSGRTHMLLINAIYKNVGKYKKYFSPEPITPLPCNH